jgi:hypothetical protein
MLVVISILAVLTMIAVQSLGPVEERSRHEATQRTLERVRDAVVTTNDAAVAGFIADTGRVPTSIADLSGLMSPTTGMPVQPADLPPFGALHVQAGPDWNGSSWAVTPGTSGNYFTLNHGWHGPYLTTSATTGDVVDGWGYSLIADPLAVGTLAVGPAGIVLRTRGKPGGTPPQVMIPTGSYSATQISGNIYSTTTDTGPWCVMVVGPGSAAENGIAVHGVTATPTGAVTTTTGGGSSSNQPVATYSITASSSQLGGGAIDFRAMLVGPRVICAAKGDASGATRTGAPVNVVVRPGAQSIDLYVP